MMPKIKIDAGLGRNAASFLLLFLYLALLGFFFAQVEIQIEGGAGWAANLPTWRIDQHPLLEVFWSGRAMTGYHAWVFSFTRGRAHAADAV